jgi:hypothetical protein
MLLKKENNCNVENLRTIVLLDSEANMNYKHLGRRAMKAAIKHNLIAPEQYSCPNRKAIDHALNRRLVIDHQLYRRQPFAMASCDLKSCYDCINHTASSLSLQCIGIAKTELSAMFDSIQQMTHQVRTAFGDSALTYGGKLDTDKWKLLPQGVLQGNGCGPTLWSILSSCIFQILQQQGHGNKIRSSIQDIQLELTGFAYVDDTDLLQVDNDVKEVVKKMQAKISDWNKTIGVTGGILAPQKCWWYLVTFRQKHGRWHACSPQGNYQIWIKDEHNKKISIQRLEPSIGTNMLGVCLSPDGNRKDHIAALRRKTDTWALNIKESRANTEEIWTAIHCTIPFSISYSLPAVTLSQAECHHIMAPIIKTGLPLAGIA